MAGSRHLAAFALRTILCASAGWALVPASAQAPADGLASPVVETPVASAAWNDKSVRQLIAAINRSGEQGLNPDDYRLSALRLALQSGEGPALDRAAQDSAIALAHDYLFGRITDKTAFDWHGDRSPNEMVAMQLGLAKAVADKNVGDYLNGLLPSDDRYRALRDALADASDPAERDRIRANMERWRWLPRHLGESYVYVNVPSYHLQLIDNGAVAASYTVVVGAKDTPTPMMVTEAPSLVVNPSWYVPASIVKKSGLRAGRGGFVATADGGVRQPPGPRNALGRLKINLVNDQAIYLHDTNAKYAFRKDDRALSHGCVRVQGIDHLAADLMRMDGGDDAALGDAMGRAQTATLSLPRSVPVYLVYFTMDRDADGSIRTYGDPYGRDAALIQQLDGPATSPMVVASN